MKENSPEGVQIFTEATEAIEAVEAIAANGYVAANGSAESKRRTSGLERQMLCNVSKDSMSNSMTTSMALSILSNSGGSIMPGFGCLVPLLLLLLLWLPVHRHGAILACSQTIRHHRRRQIPN